MFTLIVRALGLLFIYPERHPTPFQCRFGVHLDQKRRGQPELGLNQALARLDAGCEGVAQEDSGRASRAANRSQDL